MTARWPFLVLLTASVALGVRAVPDTGGTSGPPATDAPDASPVPAGSPADGPERSHTWYCAAGTVGGTADHEVLVTNPATAAADVRLTLHGDVADRSATAAPRPPRRHSSRPLTVAPGSTERISLADLDDTVVPGAVEENGDGDEGGDAAGEDDGDGEGEDRHVAALLEADSPVQVEHAVEGPHGEDRGPCATSGASQWHFAWGTTTRDARDILVLFNPFPNDVVVDGTFSTVGGLREPVRWQGLTVPARRVVAVDVGDDVTRRSAVAATVEARNGSLIAERLQVLDGSVEAEGLWLDPGRTVADDTARHPGGDLADGERELLAVYNPGARTAEIEVAVMPEAEGARVPEPFRLTVRPGRAHVLDFAAEERIDPTRSHTTHVQATNGVPVVTRQVRLDTGEP